MVGLGRSGSKRRPNSPSRLGSTAVSSTKGMGLASPPDSHEQPEPRLADGPSLCLVLLCEEVDTGVA